MYWNILKKDLKRKKTMNVILLLFVVISTMFVASSVSNILATIGGTEYFFEQAGIKDYVIFHSGDDASGEELKNMIESSDIDSCTIEEFLFLPPRKLLKDGRQHEDMQSFFLVMPAEYAKINIFDGSDNILTHVESGKAYLSAPCLKQNGLKVGDVIELDFDGYSVELEITGVCKDAIFGAKMFNTPRFIINEQDYDGILENADTSAFKGRVAYVGSSDLDEVKAAVAQLDGILFSDKTSVLKSMYLVDVVIAIILLVVSVCLILVAVVVLKFTISFTLSEEFREIGVMKAIGIRNGKIRGLYITKYIGLAVIGSIIGFFLSIPFGNMMLKSVTEQMVLGSDMGILTNVISAVAVVLTVFIFSWLCTSGVKRSTPLDAIRSGQTGERFNRKRGLRISKSHTKASTFMAFNDVFSSPKSYLTLMTAFTICLSIVLTIVITDSTLRGRSLLPTFGVVESDAFLTTDIIPADELRKPDGKDILNEKLKNVENELKDEEIPAICFAELQLNIPIEYNGKQATFRGQMCSSYIKPSEYVYTEGSAPSNKNEIAVTPAIADELGAHIGDTVVIRGADGISDEYMITAYFESMNNLGKLIRLHPDFECDYSQLSAAFNPQVKYTDEPTNQEKQERYKKIQEIYGENNVMDVSGFVEDCIGVGDMITSLKYLVLAVTMVIVALVTVLMERSFIAKEKSEIALMKAIGFKNSAVTKIHTLRFGIVSVAAAAVSCILSLPVTKLCITPIFATLGATSVDYQINPLELFGIYPAAVIVITIITAYLTSLYTATIKASDASNIE